MAGSPTHKKSASANALAEYVVFVGETVPDVKASGEEERPLISMTMMMGTFTDLFNLGFVEKDTIRAPEGGWAFLNDENRTFVVPRAWLSDAAMEIMEKRRDVLDKSLPKTSGAAVPPGSKKRREKTKSRQPRPL